jgi:hypothetical protein
LDLWGELFGTFLKFWGNFLRGSLGGIFYEIFLRNFGEDFFGEEFFVYIIKVV